MLTPSHLPELIVLLLIAAIVLGPKRLPEVGRGLGHAIRNFRQETRALSGEASAIRDEFASARDVAVGGEDRRPDAGGSSPPREA